MEVYAESLATKGHKQLDRSLADSDLVILKSPRRVTVDSGLAKHTQDRMEWPEQLVFAYQHNPFDAGNFGKVVGHNHCRMVDFDHFEYTTAHYLQRFVAQILGTCWNCGCWYYTSHGCEAMCCCPILAI